MPATSTSAAHASKPAARKNYAFYTVREAAGELGISPSLVTRYARERRFDIRGEKGAISLGKQWVIFSFALAEFARRPRKVGNPSLGG